MRFVDTNILLYAISLAPDEGAKRQRAIDLLSDRDLALSVQVLQEFYVQATHPARRGALDHREAVDFVATFARFPVQETTLDLVYAAIAGAARYRISYWDAAIIEAARMLGCDQVLSEDLSHGQDYDGAVVINPFR